MILLSDRFDRLLFYSIRLIFNSSTSVENGVDAGARFRISGLGPCFDIVPDEFKTVAISLRRASHFELRGSCFPVNNVI